ncbi:hypothetical protein CYG48_13330 [Neorhizobium sp. SOG26]|uniref:VPA1269 family protein n=1 Tax=Neorhizobium sp. SOG26 TaxID=2060726 RepID=UPI000E56C7B4|nr:VPA1269 family protein [Neorhizobium sp. SOG26]AXV16583.1 hypothetical protein CYG48_13330 [Neorhizobium sp. SOG26]
MHEYVNAQKEIVVLNLGPSHVDTLDQEEAPEIIEILDRLAAVPNNIALKEAHFQDVDDVVSSGVCIAPSYFLNGRLNSSICRVMVEQTTLGVELKLRLEDVGALAFLEKSASRTFAEAYIWRILAVVCLSSSGHSTVASLPPSFIHDLVDWLRTSDGKRWRPEVVGRDEIKVQVLRNLVLGFSRIFGDPSLEDKARILRQDKRGSTSGKAWRRFRRSSDPLEKDLAARLTRILGESKVKPNKARQVIMDIAAWLQSSYTAGTQLFEIMKRKPPEVTFSKFLADRVGEKTAYVVQHVGIAKRLCDEILLQLEEEYPEVAFRGLITESEVRILKGSSPAAARPDSSTSRPLPEKFFPLAIEILQEGPLGWLGKRFSVWMTLGGKRLKIFCPVIPTLLWCSFQMPLRIVQWRRLDSGEGDILRYNSTTKQWEDNEGPMAGYWARLANQAPDKVAPKGYVVRLDDDQGPLVGLWVNTNKTGNPYVLPWQHEGVLARLEELREWQEKFNPPRSPLSPEDYLDAAENYPESTKAKLPHIFALFRLPSGKIPSGSEMQHAWAALMAEVEQRWNERNPDEQIEIVKRQKKTGQPYAPRFNMHGLRVRGVTRLDRGGMTLRQISSVTGHASLMMAAYYVARDPRHINDRIQEAQRNADAAEDVARDFKRLSFQQLVERTVSLDQDALFRAHQETTAAEVCDVQIGICPWDGQRCFDGGPLIRSSKLKDGKDKSKYGEVPGGRRNCIMCRHFVSGPPWNVQLQAYGCKLLAKRRDLAIRQDSLNDEAQILVEKRERKEIDARYYKNEMQKLQLQQQQVMDDISSNAAARFNLETILNASLRLQRQGQTSDLVIADRDSMIEFMEVTPFQQAAWLTKMSRVYPVLGSAATEALRDRYVDVIMFNSNITPPSLAGHLSPSERRESADLFADYLLRRLEPELIDDLFDRKLTLEEAGLVEEVRALTTVPLEHPILVTSHSAAPKLGAKSELRSEVP